MATARTINGVSFDGTANITVSDSTAVKLTENQTIDGVKTFTSSPIVPTPTTNTQAANKVYVDTIIPTGVILLWSGSIASIPAGWALCDGANGTPDLRDRFVVGAGSTYGVGVTGGSKDAIVVAHTHTGTAASGGGGGSFITGFNSTRGAPRGGAADGLVPVFGAASAHTHSLTIPPTGSSGTNANLPPYYALAYIMKI